MCSPVSGEILAESFFALPSCSMLDLLFCVTQEEF